MSQANKLFQAFKTQDSRDASNRFRYGIFHAPCSSIPPAVFFHSKFIPNKLKLTEERGAFYRSFRRGSQVFRQFSRDPPIYRLNGYYVPRVEVPMPGIFHVLIHFTMKKIWLQFILNVTCLCSRIQYVESIQSLQAQSMAL